MSKFTLDLVESWINQMNAFEAGQVTAMARKRVKAIEKEQEQEKYGALFDGLKAIPTQYNFKKAPTIYLMTAISFKGTEYDKLKFSQYQPRAKKLYLYCPDNPGRHFYMNERQIKRHEPSRTQADIRRRLRDTA